MFADVHAFVLDKMSYNGFIFWTNAHVARVVSLEVDTAVTQLLLSKDWLADENAEILLAKIDLWMNYLLDVLDL